MNQIGQVYKPSGKFDLAATVFASTSGLMAAALVAGIVWAWEISGLPTLLILTSIFHGLAIGFVLAWLFKKMRLRNAKVAIAVASVCALFSVGIVHYGHYRWFVHELESNVIEDLRKNNELSQQQKQQIVARIHDGPDAAADELVFIPETGHGGFPGSMLYRAASGTSIGRHGSGMPVTGIGMWILWAFEAALVTGAAIALTSPVANEPFCESCGRWFDRSLAALRLDPTNGELLVQGVHNGDVEQINQLHALQSDLGSGAVAPRIYTCGDCGQHLADVVIRVAGEKGKYTETPVLAPTFITPEVAAALRSPPAASMAAAPV